MKRNAILFIAALALAGASFDVGRSYPYHLYHQLGAHEDVLYEQSTGRACRPILFRLKPDTFGQVAEAHAETTMPLSELKDAPQVTRDDAPKDPLPQCGSE